ncbi:kinetochore-associated Ndc80 complex subunit spc25 [Pleurotus ostreatus]|uniref:Kinetochore protein SPC25 n=2 Tax=Pleurotus ostreatus TaxID=5322 RepID=A0A067NI28_PLEO1|nr:kinetochore-associated Ndc80 complex subunit spc25 [Pleurotus ostreatus]KAF7428036.1 kinetochore-associated Ndc80 complex subunit spc25 [Pleurotus ostreatus]KAJ8696084.1 kinetochore-associated Ndc80 complex subunit spc25 [Pleurotus ostreatus]KDQ27509.1 hypothetical protein PLEOSDRAFT_1076664 [Pleurotus ostreatus PC15]
MTYVVRTPQIDLAAILAQQNPHIDLNLQPYETSTRNFLHAVSSYKNRAIAIISERRNHQLAEKKRLAEKIQSVQAETNQCRVKEISLLADLEREQAERKEAELSVAALKRSLASLKEKCSTYDAEIQEYRALIDNLRREKAKDRSILTKHATSTIPEVAVCEEQLGCTIEGIERDQLLIRFTKIDTADPEREFSFVLDVSGRAYTVKTSSPVVPTLPILLEELKTTRDIFCFIRQMRTAFRDMAKN